MNINLFKNQAAKCGAGSYKFGRGCAICPAGTWSKQGDTRCTSCPAGTRAYKHLYCIDCDPGQYSKGSSETCTFCALGQVSTARSSSCKSCLPGTYVRRDKASCGKCPLDTFSVAATDSCYDCPPGMYSAMGSTKCRSCGTGRYFDKTSRLCVKCTSPGCETTAAPTSPPTFSPSLPVATICPAGSYTVSPGSCEKCGVDQVSSIYDSPLCQPCRVGFVVNKGQTSCRRCPAGYIAQAPTSLSPPISAPDKVCVACPSGSYSYSGSTVCLTVCPNGGVPLRSRTGCTDGPALSGYPSTLPTSGPTPTISACEQGQYDDPILKKCVDCTGGYINAFSPDQPCQKCQPGTFTPNKPAAKCEKCGKGHVISADKNQCTPCPIGYYSPYISYFSTEIAECKKCPENTISRAGMGYADENFVIHNCNRCRYGVNDDKTDCKGPYIKPYDWLPDPTPTSAPTGLYSSCHAGQYEDPILKTCTDCNPGYFSPTPTVPCKKCPIGSYGYEDPSSFCDICYPGTVINDDSTDCNLCPASTYSPYVLADIDGNNVACKVCPPGTWSSEGNAFETYDNNNGLEIVNCHPCYFSEVNSQQTACT